MVFFKRSRGNKNLSAGAAVDSSEGLIALSRLSFVDMAGAERANRTGNSGQRFKESVKINGSLLALGRCLEALRHNQLNPSASLPRKSIPYHRPPNNHRPPQIFLSSRTLKEKRRQESRTPN